MRWYYLLHRNFKTGTLFWFSWTLILYPTRNMNISRLHVEYRVNLRWSYGMWYTCTGTLHGKPPRLKAATPIIPATSAGNHRVLIEYHPSNLLCVAYAWVTRRRGRQMHACLIICMQIEFLFVLLCWDDALNSKLNTELSIIYWIKTMCSMRHTATLFVAVYIKSRGWGVICDVFVLETSGCNRKVW